MEHHTNSEVTVHHGPPTGTKRIWKTFWVLLVITVIELGLGLLMYSMHGEISSWLVMAIKGIICILSLAKAFYIVSIFMHLGDEIRNMIMTIVVPLLLFIWFITAFLWDGNSYRTLRNRYQEMPESEQLKRAPKAGDTSARPLH